MMIVLIRGLLAKQADFVKRFRSLNGAILFPFLGNLVHAVLGGIQTRTSSCRNSELVAFPHKKEAVPHSPHTQEGSLIEPRSVRSRGQLLQTHVGCTSEDSLSCASPIAGSEVPTVLFL